MIRTKLSLGSAVKIFTAYLILSLLLLSGCKRQEVLPEQAKSGIGKLTVPAGFNWEMVKELPLQVKISDAKFGKSLHVIQVYDDNGKLISKGSASIDKPFETELSLATQTKKLYLIKTAPDGVRTVQNLLVSGGKIETVMQISDKVAVRGATMLGGPDPAGPSCSAGVNQIIYPDASPVQTINIGTSQTVSLSGDFNNKNLNIVYSGAGAGILRICGTNVKISQTNAIHDNEVIEISAGSTVKFVFNEDPFLKSIVRNYGTLSIEGTANTITQQGNLINYGTITSSAGSPNYRIYGADSKNYGSVNLRMCGIMTFSNEGQFKSSITVLANQFTNFCNADLGHVRETSPAKTIINRENAYLKMTSMRKLAGSLALYNNSITIIGSLTTNQSQFNHSDAGSSLMKIDHIYTLDTLGVSGYTAAALGNITVCDPNGETYALNQLGQSSPVDFVMGNGAAFGCNVTIPANTCGPGFSANAIADADLDGIADEHDDFPSDPSRAFKIPGAIGTLAFEDQWPKKGDYDMNDVVIGYEYNIVTNATNEVVGLTADYSLKAAGGNFDNGFGVEFPVNRNSIVSISGATLEAGQPKAVAIIFNSMHTELPSWNTREDDAYSSPKTFHVELSISGSPSLAALGQSAYNPFIWSNGLGFGRGCEIHLAGNMPTALANTTLYGQFDDRTSITAGSMYLTENRFPWGLNIPSADFRWPKEGADISEAYLKMPAWITSGGVEFSDWYSNMTEGYRAASKLYQH
ncbi:MAG: LruC domain-containing protein [Bacteroidota bacterium]